MKEQIQKLIMETMTDLNYDTNDSELQKYLYWTYVKF